MKSSIKNAANLYAYGILAHPTGFEPMTFRLGESPDACFIVLCIVLPHLTNPYNTRLFGNAVFHGVLPCAG